jgi:hypothetical protein
MNRMVVTLARWLASRTVKAQWKDQGRKPKIGEIDEATTVYFVEHENELLSEAWEHPAAKEWRQKERMKLARKAIVAEIRDRRGEVSSIAPDELRRLIDAYLKDHPDGAVAARAHAVQAAGASRGLVCLRAPPGVVFIFSAAIVAAIPFHRMSSQDRNRSKS